MNATLARHRRGSVLWIALVAVVIAMGIAMSMLQTSVTNVNTQDKYSAQTAQFFSTHGATELVMSDLWGRFNGQDPTAANYVSNFIVFLDNNIVFTPLPVGSPDITGEDFRSGPPSYTYSGVLGTSPPIDNPTKITRALVSTYNNTLLGDRMITGVRFYRKDRPKAGQYNIDLLVVAETQKYTGDTAAAQATVKSTLSAGHQIDILQPQWESQLFTFTSPPKFNGFDYALLTKNITCTMCHLRVRNRAMLDNIAGTLQNPPAPKSLFGQFDRVKVGVTEFLGMRAGEMYSTIDGTLYHRGTLQYENHTNVTPAQFAADTAWSVAFNPNSSTIMQDANTGAVPATPFVNATTDSSGNPVARPATNQNLYLNYSTANAGQTDGALPASNFPSPYPEIPTPVTLTTGQIINGPNNKIDPNEVAAAATGLVSSYNPTLPSSLTGGVAVQLAPNVQYNAITLPSGSTPVATSSGSVIPSPANISQNYTGNVVLTGTAANPIKIDGKVLIDGDVVIRGYVQGAGQIYATGNIYAPGDVIYNNVNVGTIDEKFGVNADPDPAKRKNLLALVAGKNIVIGDYLSQVTHWSSGETDFYTTYRYNPATKVLTPQKGMPEPGKKLVYQNGSATDNFLNPFNWGFTSPVSLPAGSTYSTGGAVHNNTTFGGSNFASYTVEQMSYFNRNELKKVLKQLPTGDPTQASSYAPGAGAPNPDYDPNYIPKFYSMYKYDPANPQTNPALAFLYNGSSWDDVNKHWNGANVPISYDYMTSVDSLPAGALSDAAIEAKNVINVHPDWIDPGTMVKILSDEQDKHVPVVADAQYGNNGQGHIVPDRRLDSILYTKNAIFAIERQQNQKYDPATDTWSKVPAKSGGYLQINGAIVAPDTGLLITGPGANNFSNNGNNRKSFVVNYDPRARTFIALGGQDFTNFDFWGMARVGMSRGSGFMPPAP